MQLSQSDTTDEIIDLVDEKDQVIGEISRKLANTDPKYWHREVSILVVDKDKKVLWQQRAMNKLINPGIWTTTCAGHIPKGVSIEDAAHMELKEEMGFDTELSFVEKTLKKDINETHFTNRFLGIYHGSEIKIEPEEVEEFRFFSKEDLEEFTQNNDNYSKSAYEFCQRYWNGEFDEIIEKLNNKK